MPLWPRSFLTTAGSKTWSTRPIALCVRISNLPSSVVMPHDSWPRCCSVCRPGLHWKFPYPIDDVVYVPVGETHIVTSTAGWYFQTPAEAAAGQKPQAIGMLRAGVDGYTLTGDGDIIHARATLSYRISDPVSYVFHFANATNLLQHVLDNALFYASAAFSADDALYRNKLAFQESVQKRVHALV